MSYNNQRKVNYKNEDYHFGNNECSQELTRMTVNVVQHVVITTCGFFTDSILQLIGGGERHLHT